MPPHKCSLYGTQRQMAFFSASVCSQIDLIIATPRRSTGKLEPPTPLLSLMNKPHLGLFTRLLQRQASGLGTLRTESGSLCILGGFAKRKEVPSELGGHSVMTLNLGLLIECNSLLITWLFLA